MEFRVLGPLELASGGRSLTVGGARIQAVLAVLLIEANRVVPADRLADELWPGHAPDRGAANLQVRLAGRDAGRTLGIGVRAGVHTGEVEILDGAVSGVCVDLTEHLARLARPAEILVTRTVKELVLGSGISFADRGSHSLGETPGTWRLFAVTPD